MLNTSTLSFDEIIKNTKLISELWIFELMIFITIIVLLFLSVFYIIPLLQIKNKISTIKKESKNRKKILNQIITQKQIEEEIEEEIKKLDLKN